MTFLGHLAEANEMINAFALGFIKKGITLAQRDSCFLGPSDLEKRRQLPTGFGRSRIWPPNLRQLGGGHHCCIQQPQVVTLGRTTGLIKVCKKRNPLSDTRSVMPAFPILLTFSSCL